MNVCAMLNLALFAGPEPCKVGPICCPSRNSAMDATAVATLSTPEKLQLICTWLPAVAFTAAVMSGTATNFEELMDGETATPVAVDAAGRFTVVTLFCCTAAGGVFHIGRKVVAIVSVGGSKPTPS